MSNGVNPGFKLILRALRSYRINLLLPGDGRAASSSRSNIQ
jgi:hypothetical protein